jgi:hypothetical protein
VAQAAVAQDDETGRTSRYELAFELAPEVREALDRLGRTEDVRFSPSGKQLAIVGFANECVGIADIEIASADGAPTIRLGRLRVFGSPALREPHGLDFLDEETIVVGNRAAGISIFRLPSDDTGGDLTLLRTIEGEDGTTSSAPGSLVVRRTASGGVELLACDNWGNTVVRHALSESGEPAVGDVVASAWLDLPDGLAVSSDGEWLAVSNHNAQNVLLYALSSGGEGEPVGMLRGVRYPHGIRFAADDATILVADAGAPVVQVFAPRGRTWDGPHYPTATLRVMDAETFARGHANEYEGGPKGIDVHPSAGVLAVTAECLPLAFFDVRETLDGSGPDADAAGLLGYELDLIHQAATAAAEAEARIAAIYRTRLWRMTLSLRRMYAAVRRLRRA